MYDDRRTIEGKMLLSDAHLHAADRPDRDQLQGRGEGHRVVLGRRHVDAAVGATRAENPALRQPGHELAEDRAE